MSGEKRSQDCEDTLHAETVIIVDIEGTTTSISFVKETLFPYVRDNLKQYIEKNWEAEEFKGDLEKLKEQAKKDETDKVDGVVSISGATPEEERESILKNVLWQMDGDRKTGALKQLQGHMWREAYKSGTVKGHVYEDVPKAFDEWTKSGRKIYVYSSGSVEAQKLLFGHSEHGDMTKYLSDYFDTEVGAKQESSSYKNILGKIDAEPSSVLFLTDIAKEAQAAKEAGLSARIVVRPGNASLTDEEKVKFTTIESFVDLSFQTMAKRQKVEKSNEKEIAKPSTTTIPEPMDTSEVAAAPSNEKITASKIEKIDDTTKTIEAARVEITKIVEKTEIPAAMDVDGKVASENKTCVIIDESVAAKGTAKNEEESKANENIEASKESTKIGEIAKNDASAAKKDAESAKLDEKKSVKIESELVKKDVAIAREDSEIAKKVSSEIAKKVSSEIAKKVTEIANKNEKEIEIAKKVSTANKTEESSAVKHDGAPMDDVKTTLPSETSDEAAIVAKTEDKTEVAGKSVKTEEKMETEASKPIAAVTESKPKNETDDKTSSGSSSSTVTSETSAEPIVTDNKSEKTSGVKEKSITAVEKIETEVVLTKTMEKIVTKDPDEKKSSKDEKIKEDTKQNGESESAKKNEAQSSDKKETNGDTKEENTKIEQVPSNPAAAAAAAVANAAAAAVAAVTTAAAAAAATAATATAAAAATATAAAAAAETTKVSQSVEKIEEKIVEPIAESAAKNDEKETENKAKNDEASKSEIVDAKVVNGTSDDKDTDKSEKPHRNGLNGDSLIEKKSNGDTKNETAAAASSQNGEAAESSSAAGGAAAAAATSAESIKTKKVVDSTMNDGAGEPEVVPPVAVAATS